MVKKTTLADVILANPARFFLSRALGIHLEWADDALVESRRPFYMEPKLPLEVTAGDGVEAPLAQPHHLAPREVDRRVDLHRARKFRRTRAPASAERSGWNCTPITLSRWTQAGTSTP